MSFNHKVALQNPSLLLTCESQIQSDDGVLDKPMSTSMSQRLIIGLAVTSFLTITFSSDANARYILNDDGDYEEVDEEDWQTVWKKRLDKAGNMTSDEIFAAARGAGNTDLKQGEDNYASKKRRAMSACRDSSLGAKAGVTDLKACNNQVMNGDVDFIL